MSRQHFPQTKITGWPDLLESMSTHLKSSRVDCLAASHQKLYFSTVQNTEYSI